MQHIQKLVESLYHDAKDPAGFGGVQRILDRLKELGQKHVTKEQVERALRSIPTYTLHKPARKIFTRNPIICGDIDYEWQADLVDMQHLETNNSGYKFIITVIDCLSKYAWARALKNKSSKSVIEAFTDIFNTPSPDRLRKPKKIQTDKGREFENKEFHEFVAKKKIHHFTAENIDIKASLAERFNRTLKNRMFAYFTANNTRRYLEVLDDLVESYNKSRHRTIGMKPYEVKTKDQARQIFHKVYDPYFLTQKKTKTMARNGSLVRMARGPELFRKGYLPNWSREVFKVTKILPTIPKKVYKVEDLSGEEITGTFYPEELQPISHDPNPELVPVQEILQRKKDKATGKNLALVKFLDHPAKFNKWIDIKDIIPVAKDGSRKRKDRA